MVAKNISAIPERIENAAGRLIFTYGVKGWNMDDCTRDAGITKRTLYQYIQSKETLVEHVLIRFIRTTQKELAAELSNCPDFMTGIDKMLQIFPRIIMKMESRTIRNIFISYPDIENRVIQERLKLADESLTYIKKGQKDGIVNNNIEAETILEILQSLVIYYLKNDPKDFEEKLKNSFKAVLYGILAH